MGVRDRPTSPRSPWQNGCAERLIGSIRRECIDHIVVLGERHLRYVLQSYMTYYNETRTNLSLNKDAPVPRPAQIRGSILGVPILGGLHHHMFEFDLRQGQVIGGELSLISARPWPEGAPRLPQGRSKGEEPKPPQQEGHRRA